MLVLTALKRLPTHKMTLFLGLVEARIDDDDDQDCSDIWVQKSKENKPSLSCID